MKAKAMIVTTITTLLAGVGLVATAPYVPSRLALIERAGGLLVCIGLICVGAGLVQMGR